MSIPLFPKLKPKLIDPLWFDVDQPCDDEEEVSQLEAQHQAWLQSISQRDSDLAPIGKAVCENLDEDDDEEDEDDNDDDDESESHDEEEEDEIEMDISQERNSPVDVINPNATV
ncbi:anaphase-promoting complex subunit 15 [Tribolium madens]|uniref:anaphase-promoting complex subunit 15 n=1 Tax=Tribolium madens TaxID=41895 RepID=UPI001CF75ABB|nr:anaphase-promoting complex subunit 15 [Tribolium madens]